MNISGLKCLGWPGHLLMAPLLLFLHCQGCGFLLSALQGGLLGLARLVAELGCYISAFGKETRSEKRDTVRSR